MLAERHTTPAAGVAAGTRIVLCRSAVQLTAGLIVICALATVIGLHPLLLVAGMATLLLLSVIGLPILQCTKEMRGFGVITALVAFMLLPATLMSRMLPQSITVSALIFVCLPATYGVCRALTGTGAQKRARILLITASVATSCAVIGRLLLAIHRSATSHQPWFSLAPNDTGGTLPFDNIFPFMLCIVLPITLCSMINSQRWRRFLLSGCLGLILTGVLLSFSRTAWLVAACELALLALLTPRLRRPVLALGLVSVIAVLLIPGTRQRLTSIVHHPSGTAEKRVYQWQRALGLVGESPIVGHGPGTFAMLYGRTQPQGAPIQPCPHNLYLHIAAECGIPALGAFWIIVVIALRARLRGTDDHDMPARHGITTAIVGLLVYGFFDL